MKRRAVLLVFSIVFLVGSGCSQEPATTTSVCAKYDELAQSLKSVGIFDNPVFSAADALGKEAQRFEESAEVQSDGSALRELADRDQITAGQLEDASLRIANLCGGPSLTLKSALS